ncbi:SDR family oxidoreductase [Pseudomonas sp.]|uniref:SDR family oxidoreductase n=1 Tax=Pseudomonas sp. TaxID=306 RepID=UPI00261CCDDD|nr:SDR family oxidoreductase [Pseudomonas sp.]
MTRLFGKTALATGASRGIGRTNALALAKAGAQMLIHYSRGEKEAAAVVNYFAAVLGERGTHVNAIASEGIEAERSSPFSSTASGEHMPTMPAHLCTTKPEDIGEVVVFLASNGARWISGETLHVDSGSKH